MKNLFQNNRKNTVSFEEDDAATIAIEKVNQEKDEMRKGYETRIVNLEHQHNATRTVLQALVKVARKSPEAFFAVLDDEGEDWSLIDLKYIASSINIQLEDAIERKIRRTSNGDKVTEMQLSTAQRLYEYIMMDPKAKKQTAIHVIHELHEELASLEDQELNIENDVQPPSKMTIQIENVMDQPEEEVEVDKAGEVFAISGFNKIEDDDSTTATIDSIDSMELASGAFYAL